LSYLVANEILHLSIVYFTVATEMRFVEIDKQKGKIDEVIQTTNFKHSY
jgi:hypothetical protein